MVGLGRCFRLPFEHQNSLPELLDLKLVGKTIVAAKNDFFANPLSKKRKGSLFTQEALPGMWAVGLGACVAQERSMCERQPPSGSGLAANPIQTRGSLWKAPTRWMGGWRVDACMDGWMGGAPACPWTIFVSLKQACL